MAVQHLHSFPGAAQDDLAERLLMEKIEKLREKYDLNTLEGCLKFVRYAHKGKTKVSVSTAEQIEILERFIPRIPEKSPLHCKLGTLYRVRALTLKLDGLTKASKACLDKSEQHFRAVNYSSHTRAEDILYQAEFARLHMMKHHHHAAERCLSRLYNAIEGEPTIGTLLLFGDFFMETQRSLLARSCFAKALEQGVENEEKAKIIWDKLKQAHEIATHTKLPLHCTPELDDEIEQYWKDVCALLKRGAGPRLYREEPHGKPLLTV